MDRELMERLIAMIPKDDLQWAHETVQDALIESYCDGVADGLRLSVSLDSRKTSPEEVANRILEGFRRRKKKEPTQ